MKKTIALFIAATMLVACFCVFSGCEFNESRAKYEIECEFDGEKIVGKEKVTFYNFTENAFDTLKFNLFANAFRKDAKYSPVSTQYYFKAYENGESYGEESIKKVTEKGEPLEFSVCGEDLNLLCVTLKNQVFPNERVTVEIEFETVLADVIARTGINSKTVNLANFYPVLCGIENGAFYECVYYSVGDPFFSDPADYNVTFTFNKKYTVASSGEFCSSFTENEKVTAKYLIKNARSFAFTLSEKFNTLTEKVGKTEIVYYYVSDAAPQETIATAKEALEFFGEKFGEYPFKTFSVVQTPFIPGGMEFSALVFVSDELEPAALKEVVVHEAAHQWWQTVVGNNEIKHPFIDEGLAEYSVVLFYEQFPKYGFNREVLIKSAEKTFKVFCSVFDKIKGTVNTSMLRSLPEYSGEYEYVNIAYVKACVMFDYLRTTVGDKAFFSGLKRFYDENAYKTATPESLVGAFERAGADCNGFFDSFFNGKEII